MWLVAGAVQHSSMLSLCVWWWARGVVVRWEESWVRGGVQCSVSRGHCMWGWQEPNIIHGVYTVILAGKSPNTRSYTVHIYMVLANHNCMLLFMREVHPNPTFCSQKHTCIRVNNVQVYSIRTRVLPYGRIWRVCTLNTMYLAEWLNTSAAVLGTVEARQASHRRQHTL